MRISLHTTKNKMKHIFICIMDFKGRHAMVWYKKS